MANAAPGLGRLLIATNGSRSSRRAAQMGVALASAVGAEVIAMSVVPTNDLRLGPHEVGALKHLQTHHISPVIPEPVLQAVELLAAESGVRCRTQLVASRNPADAIAAEAVSMRVGLVVMGTGRRRSLRAARKVIRRGRCPVLLVDSDDPEGA